MALIEMNGVTKKYHRSTTALRDITVSVNPGEFVYIVGPSVLVNLVLLNYCTVKKKYLLEPLKLGNLT